MVEVYLKRDNGLGEYYVIFKIEERHLPFYSTVQERQIDCKKCKFKKKILASNTFSPEFCPKCVDKRLQKIVKKMEGKVIPHRPGNIPSWRLDMEDATPEDILNRSPDDFKVPFKTKAQWEEYYKQPHELKRQEQFEKKQREKQQEALKSLG